MTISCAAFCAVLGALAAACSETAINSGNSTPDGGASADGGGGNTDGGAGEDAAASEERSVTGTWEKVEVKDADGNPLTTMASVVVVSPTEVYVVEGSSNLGTGFYRFDGSAWTSVRYSDFATQMRLFPSGEVVAFGTSMMQKSATGNTWKALPSPDAYLSDIAGDSATSMLLSTGTGVMQRSGGSWKAAPGMPAKLSGHLLRTKEGNVFFSASTSTKTEFYRFNGTAWEDLKAKLPADNQAGGTRGIFGAAADDMWLVSSARHVLRFDGSAFAEVAGPDDEWGCDLFGGFATSKKNAWLYGANGCIFHWDGSAWKKTETGMTEPIYSIHGSDPENVWAVPGTKTHVLRLKPAK